MEGFNAHHAYWPRSQWNAYGNGAKTLRCLTTVMIPAKTTHRAIHKELPPVLLPSHNLIGELLVAARAVPTKGIERLDTQLDLLKTIVERDNKLSLEANILLGNLACQREFMVGTYPISSLRLAS